MSAKRAPSLERILARRREEDESLRALLKLKQDTRDKIDEEIAELEIMLGLQRQTTSPAHEGSQRFRCVDCGATLAPPFDGVTADGVTACPVCRASPLEVETLQ